MVPGHKKLLTRSVNRNFLCKAMGKGQHTNSAKKREYFPQEKKKGLPVKGKKAATLLPLKRVASRRVKKKEFHKKEVSYVFTLTLGKEKESTGVYECRPEAHSKKGEKKRAWYHFAIELTVLGKGEGNERAQPPPPHIRSKDNQQKNFFLQKGRERN